MHDCTGCHLLLSCMSLQLAVLKTQLPAEHLDWAQNMSIIPLLGDTE